MTNSRLDGSLHTVEHAEVRRRVREVGRRLALDFSGPFDPSAPKANGPVDVVDIFCGCGGLSLGFEAVGRAMPSYRLAGAADINRWAVQTYAVNLPISPIQGDVMEFASTPERLDAFVASLALRPDAPKILVGGPPCQGFSAHRKKDGKPEDARNDLVRAFARIAERIRPELVVMENVPEILAKKHWRQFEGFRDVLEGIGYTVSASIHNLATFGVPQERFRALIVASKRPIEMPQGFLAPEEFRTVRDAIGGLPAVEPGGPSPSDPLHYCTRHRQSTVDVIKMVPRDGGKRPAGVGPACLQRVNGFRDVYGRMYWDRPANTVTAYARNPASGRYVHPEQHRGLTIREAALLQGFPARFHFEGPFDDKFIQIGNAVPATFAAYLAAFLLGEIMAMDKGEPNFVRGREIVPTSDSFSSGIAGRKRGKGRACAVTLR